MGMAMVSYALNLSLGVLVGGLGARLRLYARLGCRKSVATRVAVVLGGVELDRLCLGGGRGVRRGALTVPQGWDVGSGVLR